MVVGEVNEANEVNTGSLIVYRLKVLTRANKIAWMACRLGFQTTYRGIFNFKIVRENSGLFLYVGVLYNSFSIVNAGLPYLVDAIEEQNRTISEKEKTEILSAMLGKGDLQTVLEILGQ